MLLLGNEKRGEMEKKIVCNIRYSYMKNFCEFKRLLKYRDWMEVMRLI